MVQSGGLKSSTRGAQPGVKAKEGESAMNIAERENLEDIIALLGKVTRNSFKKKVVQTVTMSSPIYN